MAEEGKVWQEIRDLISEIEGASDEDNVARSLMLENALRYMEFLRQDLQRLHDLLVSIRDSACEFRKKLDD